MEIRFLRRTVWGCSAVTVAGEANSTRTQESNYDSRAAWDNQVCDCDEITDPAIHALVADGHHTCTGAARQRGASVVNANGSRI